MKKILAILIAVGTGLIILAGYFLGPRFAKIPNMLVDWGVLLIGVIGLVGLGYLVKMHIDKLRQREEGAFFSVVVLISFLIALVAGLIWTLQNRFYRELILNVQVPVEAGLLGILAVTLLYTSLRLIRVRGWTPMSVGFLVSAIISLLLNAGLFQTENGPFMDTFITFWRSLPIVGARGILLGMALGGMFVGIRVLLTIDQPYGEG